MVRPTGLEGFRIFFLSTGLPNVPGGFRFSMVRPTRLVCRGPQTLKGHLHGFGHPGVIAFLHGFARFAHASSFDWFAQPVGFPSTPNPNPNGNSPSLRNVQEG